MQDTTGKLWKKLKLKFICGLIVINPLKLANQQRIWIKKAKLNNNNNDDDIDG